MALKKKIKGSNGVECGYHRILFLQITPNRGNSIVVQSYVDEASRESEASGENEAIYRSTVTYETEYDENMTIKKAYQYLKKLDKFSDSEDA